MGTGDDVLAEIRNVRQIPGEGRRRWFRDDDMDLIIWYDDSGILTGFQLCYDKQEHEKALTWRKATGYEHHGVDSGEGVWRGTKGTPVLTADGAFEQPRVLNLFDAHSERLDPRLRAYIRKRLELYAK